MKTIVGALPLSFDRLKRELFGIAVPLGIILMAIVSSPQPGTIAVLGYSLPVLCPFRSFTGFDCPGCGITRALVLAFHGQWRASFLMHMWGIPLGILLVSLVTSRSISLVKTLLGQSVPAARRILPAYIRTWISHFVVLSLLVPWAIKTVTLLYILYF